MYFYILGSIWRRARINIPTLLGQSTYKIRIVGIVGAKTTGGNRGNSLFFALNKN